jgi:ankyrin repeat protein
MFLIYNEKYTSHFHLLKYSFNSELSVKYSSNFPYFVSRPIHDAADNGKTDSLRLLIAYGADPFISTYSGRSVIDCAKRTEAKDYIKGQGIIL